MPPRFMRTFTACRNGQASAGGGISDPRRPLHRRTWIRCAGPMRGTSGSGSGWWGRRRGELVEVMKRIQSDVRGTSSRFISIQVKEETRG